MIYQFLFTNVSRGVIRTANLVAIAFLLNACSDSGFKVTTEFASSKGLEIGEPVMYEGQQVGVVTDFEEGLNSAKVEIALNPDKVDMFHTKSVVIVNALEVGTPVEIYNRTTADPVPLKEGQELQGLDSMFELGAWMVGDVIQLGSGTLSDLFESFTGYLEGDQFDEDKQQVQKQLSDAALAAKQAVSGVEVDLNQAIEDLKTSESKMSTAIDQMGEELSPTVRELSESGSQLIAQLEEFAQNIEIQVQQNPQFGEELLQSLVNVFGKLNAEINGEITIDTEDGPHSYELHSGQVESVQEIEPERAPELDLDASQETEEAPAQPKD
jgi:ABC-type transporter Mla subunit MlaD